MGKVHVNLIGTWKKRALRAQVGDPCSGNERRAADLFRPHEDRAKLPRPEKPIWNDQEDDEYAADLYGKDARLSVVGLRPWPDVG